MKEKIFDVMMMAPHVHVSDFCSAAEIILSVQQRLIEEERLTDDK